MQVLANRHKGFQAETVAWNYLERIGYRLVQRNFTIRGGEIDIVAFDEEDLVFVEVKARATHDFGSPIEAITFHKKQALLKTAYIFLHRYGWGHKPFRFDLLTIDSLDLEGGGKIELYKNIFYD